MLFSRFPGNKLNYHQIWDGGTYDAVIEPFGGSASFSQKMISKGCKNVFIADADPSVYAVYSTWLDKNMHSEFYSILKNLQANVCEKTDLGWHQINWILNDPGKFSTMSVAAASLILRYLTFGGIVRRSANEMLNVTYCADRVISLSRWKYQLPHIPPRCKINIYSNWKDCVKAFDNWIGLQPHTTRAIALIDPPYYSDRALGVRMTPAYPGHKPHNIETIDLTTKPLAALLQMPQVTRLVVTNYVSKALSKEIEALSLTTKIPMRFTSLKRLDTMQRSHSSKTENIEGIWEFGYPEANQLSLLG